LRSPRRFYGLLAQVVFLETAVIKRTGLDDRITLLPAIETLAAGRSAPPRAVLILVKIFDTFRLAKKTAISRRMSFSERMQYEDQISAAARGGHSRAIGQAPR
jgi:hypothetical protein